jgi:hypothetical protein
MEQPSPRIQKLEAWLELERRIEEQALVLQGLLEKRKALAAEVPGLSSVTTWHLAPPTEPKKMAQIPELEASAVKPPQAEKNKKKKNKRKDSMAEMKAKMARLEQEARKGGTLFREDHRPLDQSQSFQGDPNKN